jgi:hypothetical protein
METLFIARITVLDMGPDTNYFRVQDNRTKLIYTLGRSSARHYEHIRTGHVLEVLASSKGHVVSVNYPELDQLAAILVGNENAKP